MTASYAKHVSQKETPQTEPIPGSTQVANSAGGYTWTVDCWKRLERFLILGGEGGTYYISERKLTIENAQAILECAAQDAARTVAMIVGVSDAGRAPKNDPAVFALALLAGQKGPASKLALEALNSVCRIGTHLFQFCETLDSQRGWGRAVRRALAKWYTDKKPEQVAYQVTKYQQRNGWSHRDVLRLCHAQSEAHNQLFKYVTQPEKFLDEDTALTPGLNLVMAVENAKRATTDTEIVRLVREHGLVRECIPTQWLNSTKVWEALLEDMPITALVRNLGKLSSIGLVAPLSEATKYVTARLTDEALLKRGRVHPLALLIAQKIYAQGKGDKGSLTWKTVPQVVDALDDAFYKAFAAVEPTGKRWFLGLDVSGSMSVQCAGSPIECREAVGALALVTAKTEPHYAMAAFSSNGWQGNGKSPYAGYGNGIELVDFSRLTRLDTALRKLAEIPMGGTDCSLPMLYALEHKIPVDVFVVMTDSETYAGQIQPAQALRKYRKAMGLDSKLIVLAMASNGFTIADPNDAGMLDVVGFDTTVPQVMAEFAR